MSIGGGGAGLNTPVHVCVCVCVCMCVYPIGRRWVGGGCEGTELSGAAI